MPRPGEAGRRASDRLRALAGDPERQAEFAVSVIEQQPDAASVLAALAILEAHPRDDAREALIAFYQSIDAHGARRDPGGFTRAAIVRALTPIALEREAPTFERAATTSEPSTQDPGGPTALRAAGLVALAKVSPERAALRAAAALADIGNAAPGNGEPAVTAARVLAWLRERPALITFLQALPGGPDEAVGEALKGLAGGPGDIIAAIAAPFAGDRREVVLLGLCDLLVEHREDDALLPAASAFLASTRSLDVYSYLVAAMVASRRDALMSLLRAHADAERWRPKLEALADALQLSPDPRAADARRVIAARLERSETEPDPGLREDPDDDLEDDLDSASDNAMEAIRRARASVAAKQAGAPRRR